MAYPIVLVTAGTPEVALRIGEGLARYGYDARIARDQAEALAIVHAERRIGVVVADVESGGLALAQQARNARPGLGVIYTAGFPQHIPAAATVKDAPVLRTPYTAHQLVSVIAGLGKRALDEPLAA